jgi:hypothetical protein
MLALGEENKFLVYDGVYKISYNRGYSSPPIIEQAVSSDTGYVFDKDEPKCVVRLSQRYYHTFMQTLGIILQEFNKNKDTHFFIIIESPSHLLLENHILFFINTLKSQDIKYTLLDLGHYKLQGHSFLIKDFYYYDYPQLTDTFVTNLYNVSKKYHFEGEPFRKVYCSRKKTKYQTGSAIYGNRDPKTLPIKDDSERLSGELELENYLLSKGFEVICPEDFDNFEDQIRYFSSIKTLVSPTGAGLTSMCFMKEGSQLVELTIPMLVQGSISLHNHYSSMAWAKKLVYFSIPSMRSAKEVIDTIENNSILLSLISEGSEQ